METFMVDLNPPRRKGMKNLFAKMLIAGALLLSNVAFIGQGAKFDNPGPFPEPPQIPFASLQL